MPTVKQVTGTVSKLVFLAGTVMPTLRQGSGTLPELVLLLVQ